MVYEFHTGNHVLIAVYGGDHMARLLTNTCVSAIKYGPEWTQPSVQEVDRPAHTQKINICHSSQSCRSSRPSICLDNLKSRDYGIPAVDRGRIVPAATAYVRNRVFVVYRAMQILYALYMNRYDYCFENRYRRDDLHNVGICPGRYGCVCDWILYVEEDM